MTMRRSGGLVHAIAGCHDCGWSAPHWRNAQAIAVVHAKKLGHTVWVELGMAFEYGPNAGGRSK